MPTPELKSYPLTEAIESYVPLAVYAENKEAIDRDFICRKTRDNEIVMHATELLGILPPASDLDLKDIPLCDTSSEPSSDTSSQPGKEDDHVDSEMVSIDDVAITVRAKWLQPDVKSAKSATNANVFGAYGSFELVDYSPNLVLPTVELDSLSDEDLKTFGAKRLTPERSKCPSFNTFKESLFVIVYDYSKEYVEKYVLDKELGGGWFIETHNFPHFFKPMCPDCEGSAIIGKLISEDSETKIGTYKLVSVHIKFPDAIAIESGVIHGNSGFIGPYAIPSNPHGTASIVLIHDKNDQIQMISQPTYKNPHTFFNQRSDVRTGAICLAQQAIPLTA